MPVKVVYRVSKWLSWVVSGIASVLCLVMLMLAVPPVAAFGPTAALGLVCLGTSWVGGIPAAVFIHECGHLLACLALRVRVRAFRIGSQGSGACRFRVRGVIVALGTRFAGRVEHDPVPSRWRTAVIVMAGPLANLVVAGVLLALSLATAPALTGAIQVPLHQAIEVSLAGLFGATGISNLLPYRTRHGRLSDGARLLTLGNGRLARALRQDEMVLQGPDGTTWRPPSPEETADYELDYAVLKQLGSDARLPPGLLDKWLAAYRDRTSIGLMTAGAVGRTLRKDGRVNELVELLESYPAPYGSLAPAMTHSLHILAYEVALVPGMPPDVTNMAADRLRRAIDADDSTAAYSDRAARAGVLHSMAVAQLRQGNADMVEDLCRTGLASTRLSPTDRATVLATVVLARQALGQPYDRLLAEATALDPDADLVPEASWRSAAARI